jgi:hypothetical protein
MVEHLKRQEREMMMKNIQEEVGDEKTKHKEEAKSEGERLQDIMDLNRQKMEEEQQRLVEAKAEENEARLEAIQQRSLQENEDDARSEQMREKGRTQQEQLLNAKKTSRSSISFGFSRK